MGMPVYLIYAIPILATKLYIPPARTGVVSRARLIERLNDGVVKGRKLALVSAPAFWQDHSG
jgi:LuxR family maltose regulon positive regulatory protein